MITLDTLDYMSVLIDIAMLYESVIKQKTGAIRYKFSDNSSATVYPTINVIFLFDRYGMKITSVVKGK